MAINLKCGNGKVMPVDVTTNGTYIYFKFPYNLFLKDKIKAMDGARWDPDKKLWYVNDNVRNRFQLKYLAGKDPYKPYFEPYSPLEVGMGYIHQKDMAGFMLARKRCIIAGEMGVGKTLAAILTIMCSGCKDVWWVAPRSAIRGVELEFIKWKCPIKPLFLTYEGMTKKIETWNSGDHAPQMVFFDEASKLKTPTTKRSQAAMHLANSIREEYQDDAYVILMSGSPAPKSPADWWHLCEVACPGYLLEGNILKFKQRLGLIVQKESPSGGVYPQLVTWRDDETKCQNCGEKADYYWHDRSDPDYHPFIKSVNEVHNLYKRMQGLVYVKFKKDCLDLPKKVKRIIECPPTKSMLNAAKLIAARSPRAVTALTLLRELSDGFQYKDEVNGTTVCPLCSGSGTVNTEPDGSGSFEATTCPNCNGNKEVDRIVRSVQEVPCPKEDALGELLEAHEDCGRFIVYAGFQASVDRVVNFCLKNGWGTIRVDGRGWIGHDANRQVLDNKSLLSIFQEQIAAYPRLCFVGQPGAAGMGITLTASPSICYYSNDFNAESRIQSEARIDRPGSTGNNIIDLFHLPSDKLVHDNLMRKFDLQAMSLGQLKEAFDSPSENLW